MSYIDSFIMLCLRSLTAIQLVSLPSPLLCSPFHSAHITSEVPLFLPLDQTPSLSDFVLQAVHVAQHSIKKTSVFSCGLISVLLGVSL